MSWEISKISVCFKSTSFPVTYMLTYSIAPTYFWFYSWLKKGASSGAPLFYYPESNYRSIIVKKIETGQSLFDSRYLLADHLNRTSNPAWFGISPGRLARQNMVRQVGAYRHVLHHGHPHLLGHLQEEPNSR